MDKEGNYMFEPGIYEQFIYKRTYSRWLNDSKRREEYNETVDRYLEFFLPLVPENKQPQFFLAIDMIRTFSVMPSMRSFFTAGKALKKENIAGYNCCAIIIKTIKSFAELLYILMNGTGVGFSVERQFINELPEIPYEFEETDTVISFADSKKGWAEGIYIYLRCLFNGEIPKYNLSKIRPKGSILKTFGGRASGPEPLEMLLKQCKRIITGASGRKLNSIECHDICCFIEDAVVVGGVRRSSGISMTNLSDERMRNAKSGEFWLHNPQRVLANISTVYTEKPEITVFLEEWKSLIKSRAGERGIINREALEKSVIKTGRRKPGYDWVLNPCGEIILRPNSFCNLSEVVVRPGDTKERLFEKVKSATIFGCVQSTLTNFKFISNEFKKNCEEERLLGVSLTGIRDHNILNTVNDEAKQWLSEMKQVSIDTAKEWAEILGINIPVAITTAKPSGTVSQLVNSSSGIHTRFAKFYKRRVRVTATDPLCKFLLQKGIPHFPENGQMEPNVSTYVFEFAIKSPDNAIVGDDVDAIEQLEYWKMIKEYWCEHNPSCTIFVSEDEWLEVGSWIYKNWNIVTGLSFLPKDNSVYNLAPYEKISEEEFYELCKSFPEIDFSELNKFEDKDNTEGAKEYACSSGSCEI